MVKQWEARARGCLLGQAVGDALGTTVEFAHESSIVRSHPRGVTELEGGGPFGLKPGQVTDDTELALALARSIVERGGYEADAAAERYAGWLESEPFDVGGTTSQAFRGHARAGQGLAARMAAQASRESQANGSLMRQSPLGVHGALLPDERLLAHTLDDTRLSHPHPVCQAAGAVFTFTIARAVRTGEPGAALYDAALAWARASPQAQPIVDSLEAAKHELPIEFLDHMGWVRIAFQSAFHLLATATSFEAALVGLTRKGGDTDTNCAIAGALLGAAMGEEAIPRRWRETVLSCRTDRPAAYQCGDLRELAVRLLESFDSR
jgi:ADP-ribosylglycohydrolase